MRRTDRLGEEKVTILLKQFSVPATVGMLVGALYNIIDRMYIGNSPDLGTLGLAGITISFPITLVMMALAMLFGIGGATMFSIKLGEQLPETAEKYLGNSVSMLVLVSTLFMVVSLFLLDPLMTLFGASEEVMPYAVEYMRIVLWGSVFQGLSMGLNSFVRADGSPKIAMVSMFLGAGFNIIFDPIFIYVFRWGMTGAALATIGGQLLTTIWVLSYFTGSRCTIRLKPERMRLEAPIVARMVQTGTPSFFRQIANSLMHIMLNRGLIQYGGDIAVSGMGVINSIQTFMLMPIFGITQGAQPIIGFNFGAKKMERVRETLKLAIYVATLIIVTGWLATRLFPDFLIRMFSSDPELLAFGTRAIRIWFLFLPVIGFQIVSASYFQAIGRARVATFLTLSRQLIILIPAVILLPRYFGLTGILYAAPLADILSSVLTAIWLSVELKRLNLMGEERFIKETK
jgi:putative MATE family efflux protein